MKQIIKICSLLGAFVVPTVLNAQDIYPNECYNGSLTNYQTSWIANDGGTPRWHVPHSMSSLFVREDGTVATICNWDEGGTNVGIWRDGKLISIPVQSGTGSWGRNSGEAVVLDDKYVYQLMRFNGNSGDATKLNSNGLWMYPPKGSGIEYQLITRYDIETGAAASFPLGYGPLNNMLFVCSQEERYLQGLAISDNKLIVAVPGIPSLEIPDSLKIYDKTTMSSEEIGGFRITEGGVGQLYADKRGLVWMLQKDLHRIVAIDLRSGAIRPNLTIELDEDVDPRSFSIDSRESGQERLLLANSGKDLNILIYTDIYTAPKLTDTFGVTGGILVKSDKAASEGGGQYLQGEVGYMRMPGPTGVGVDVDGNIYISNMFAGTVSAILYSYKEKEKTLNWKQEGLVFTTVGDFDQTQRNKVYTTEKIYELDYTKEGQRMDKLIAHTVDPFAFPQDFRLEPNPPTPIKTGTFKRRIQGRDYLFVNNMYATILGGYRFDEQKHGYIAIPCVEVRADGLRFWQDKNGDGQQSDDEYSVYPVAGSTFSLYPDHNGNIWLADRNTRPAYSSFRVWRVSGVDEYGALQYAEPVSYRLPAYITDVNRVLYDVERDELLVSCYTTANPSPNSSIWGQVGTTILTFKNMKEKFANIESVPSEQWKYDQELVIPTSPKTTQGTTTDPGVEISAKAMTYAGDYIFTFLCANGTINIYERSGENRFVGSIEPGIEVERKSGWTDFCFAINARKNSDGTYEILAEENAYAKVLHYTIHDFEGDFTKKGDLEPMRIFLKDGAGTLIDQTNVPEGQPVTFTVRVENTGVGPVTNKRWSIPARCVVTFTVTDTNTNEVLYEADSPGYEEDIYENETIDFSIAHSSDVPFWIYTKGVYRVDVLVNSTNNGDECSMDNNSMSLVFGGGDNSGEIIGPLEPPVDKLADVRLLKLSVYPNPAMDYLTICAGTDDTDIHVAMTSILGKNVLSEIIKNNSSIDVSGLSKGCYFLQVTSTSGSRTEKIVIK